MATLAPPRTRVLPWLVESWLAAAIVATGVALALVTLVAGEWSLALVLVLLQLPLYGVHQVEEHLGDRFRLFVNDTLADGREALTPLATMVINVPGVWGLNLAALYLARFVDVGLGLIAVYLVLVNAAVHLLGSVALRRPNPGTFTAAALFLPVGVWSAIEIGGDSDLGWGAHAIGLAVALAVHASIVGHVHRRLRAL